MLRHRCPVPYTAGTTPRLETTPPNESFPTCHNPPSGPAHNDESRRTENRSVRMGSRRHRLTEQAMSLLDPRQKEFYATPSRSSPHQLTDLDRAASRNSPDPGDTLAGKVSRATPTTKYLAAYILQPQLFSSQTKASNIQSRLPKHTHQVPTADTLHRPSIAKQARQGTPAGKNRRHSRPAAKTSNHTSSHLASSSRTLHAATSDKKQHNLPFPRILRESAALPRTPPRWSSYVLPELSIFRRRRS